VLPIVDTESVFHDIRGMKTRFVNITITLEESVARGARLEAAKRNTNVSPFLLTDDLQSGQDFDGLLVINPFLRGPASVTT
jgi:hypothetical protein